MQIKPLSPPSVLWPQVWGLAAMQGAITLAWVIYNLYLLDLLTQFGFSATLATALLIGENALGIVMEPLMGSLSDGMQRWVSSRFPLIAVGVILASACFISIPAIVVWGRGVPGLLPTMMVVWALAMTVFRSPALSLLGRYAFASKMPQAASILTLVGGISGAMGPLAGNAILGMGPLLAFGIGSIVMLLAATVLRSVRPNERVSAAETADPPTDYPNRALPEQGFSVPKMALVFLAGVGVTFGFRLMMHAFPAILRQQQLAVPTGVVLGLMFVALAIAAIPTGQLANRFDNRLLMGIGLIAMAGLCLLMGLAHNGLLAIAIAVLLGAIFSLVANGTIPFALSMVPPHKGGLGTGLYFGGGALASSAFGLVLNRLLQLPVYAGGLLAAAGFFLAAVCVLIQPGTKKV